MKKRINLAKDPVLKLVLRLAIPTMLAQFVSVFYSIVDRMYIGIGVGDLALAGVGVCGPIVMGLSSFSTLIGLGGSPIMAMRMGAGKKEEAQKVLNNAFLMLLALSAILTVSFLLLKDNLLMWFGASASTFAYADTYMTIYTVGTFFALMAAGMNSFLICQGFAGLGMITVTLGAVMNIALDPLFIFTFDMGVAGAALATVLSQMFSCILVLLALCSRRVPIRLGIRGFSPPLIWQIIRFGMSPFLIIASDSVLLIVLNTMIQRHGGPGEGDLLVTCATIAQSYMLLITMPMGGLTLGAQPIVSFNFGAGHRDRIVKAVKAVLGLCLLFCGIMMVITHTLSPYFVRLFTSNPEVISRSVTYIKIFTCMIIPLAVQYALVDQTIAMGYVRLALFCSMFRKSSFLVVCIVLPMLFGAQAVFFAEPIVDVVAATVSTCLFLRFVPQGLRQLEPCVPKATPE